MDPMTPVAPASRGARVRRGLGAAALAVATAAVSHSGAGAEAPSPAVLALAVLLVAPVAVLLAGRSLGLLRLGLVVASSQLLFHGLFSWLSGPVALVSAEGAAGAHAGHGLSASLQAVAVESAHAHEAPGMLAAHLAAALVTVLAVRFAARSRVIVHAALRLVIARAVAVVRALPVALPVPIPRERPAFSLRLSARLAGHGTVLSHRGPPLLLAA